MNCCLGSGIHNKFYSVCSKCFRNVYNIGKTQFYSIKSQIKRGYTESHAGDRTNQDGSGRSSFKNSPAFVHALMSHAESRGITLDRHQMASLAVPNNPASLTLLAWLDDYFSMVGEVAPNGHDVELENTPINEIYEEYMFDLDCLGLKRLEWSKGSFEITLYLRDHWELLAARTRR